MRRLPRPDRGFECIFVCLALEVEEEAEAVTDVEADPKPPVFGADTEGAKAPCLPVLTIPPRLLPLPARFKDKPEAGDGWVADGAC